MQHKDTKARRHKEDEISHQIIGAAIEVHRTLGGQGLLESIYESALCHELILRGLRIQRQKPVQVNTGSYIFKINRYKIRALGQFWSSLCEGRCFTNNKRHLIDFFVSLN